MAGGLPLVPARSHPSLSLLHPQKRSSPFRWDRCLYSTTRRVTHPSLRHNSARTRPLEKRSSPLNPPPLTLAPPPTPPSPPSLPLILPLPQPPILSPRIPGFPGSQPRVCVSGLFMPMWSVSAVLPQSRPPPPRASASREQGPSGPPLWRRGSGHAVSSARELHARLCGRSLGPLVAPCWVCTCHWSVRRPSVLQRRLMTRRVQRICE